MADQTIPTIKNLRGNIGIGTASPSAKLHVVGGDIRTENRAFFAGRRSASEPSFSFHDDSDTGMFNIASNILAFATSGSERVRIASDGLVTFAGTGSGALTIGSHIDLGDSQKLRFGASDDLEIYHDSSNNNNYIQANNGRNLLIESNGLSLRSQAGENMITATGDGAVGLYYDNSKKFETTSAGATITGDLTVSGGLTINGTTTTIDTTNLLVEDKNIVIGNVDTPSDTTADGGGITLKGASDYTIAWTDSTNYWTFNQGIEIDVGGTNAKGIKIGNDSYAAEIVPTSLGGVAVSSSDPFLFYINSAVRATFTTDGKLNLPDNGRVTLGSANDLSLWHSGSHSYINNDVGDLFIYNNTNDGNITFYSDDGSGGVTEYFRVDGGANQNVFPVSVLLNDGVYLHIGTGSDLQLYHDATNSNIQNNTGDLRIHNTADDKDILLICDDGSGGNATYIQLDGSVTRNKLLQHTSLPDGKNLILGAGDDLQLYHDGSDSFIRNYTGSLYIKNEQDDGDIIFQCDDGSGGVETYFFLDGSKSTGDPYTIFPNNSFLGFGDAGNLLIRHTGLGASIQNNGGDIDITQNTNDGDIRFYCDDGSGGTAEYFRVDGGAANILFSKELRLLDGVQLQLGTGNDFQVFHNGSNGAITNNTGNLIIKNNNDDGDIIFESDDGSGGVETYFYLDGSLSSGNPFTIFPDNSSCGFGANADLRLSHDGTNSAIYNLTGSLYITNYANDSDIIFSSDDGSGGTEIYFYLDGSLSSGNPFTIFPDNSRLGIGTGADLYFLHNGTDSQILNTNGHLYIVNYADDKDIILQSDDGSGGATAYLTLDGSGGYMWASKNLVFADSVSAQFGNVGDLLIHHNGTNSYIQNDTGDFRIEQRADDGDMEFYSDNGSGGIAKYFHLDGGEALTIFSYNTRHNDNVIARWGTGNDLNIYHDGSSSIISNATGHLDIKNDANDADIRFFCDDGSNGLTTYFYLDGSLADGTYLNTRFPDNSRILFGTGGDFVLNHDGTNSYIDNETGDLYIRAKGDDKDIVFQSDNGSGGLVTYFYLDGSYGGTVFNRTATWTDNDRVELGTGSDLRLSHNGTSSEINNYTGNLFIRNYANDSDIIFDCDDGSGGTETYFFLDGSASSGNPFTVFPDLSELAFGDSRDFRIKHTGDTYLTNYSGDFYIRQTVVDKDIIFKADDGSGGTETYFYLDGSLSGGSPYTVFPDDSILTFGSGGGDMTIHHDGTDSKIRNQTGDLYITQNTNDGDIIFECDNGSGGVTTYLQLDGGGAITRSYRAFRVQDDVKLQAGSSGDLDIKHSSNNSYIENHTGHLYVTNTADDSDITFRTDDGSGGVTKYFQLDGGLADGTNLYTVFPDNSRIRFGDGLDLDIHHDGSNSYISQTGTGHLYIQQTVDGADMVFKNDDGSGGLHEYMRLDGGMYHVIFSKSTQHADGAYGKFGTGGDLQLSHNGTNSFIKNTNGDLYIENSADDKDIIFKSDDGSGGTETYFFLDGSVSSGSPYTTFPDNSRLTFGDGRDLQIMHNGTNTVVENLTGNLSFINYADDKDIIFQCDDGSGGTTTYFSLDGSGAPNPRTTFPDNSTLQLGTGGDLQIFNDSADSFIRENTRHLYIQNTANDCDIYFQSDDGSGGTETYFFLDGSVSSGNPVTKFPDNSILALGTSGDFYHYHDGTDSYHANFTGDFYIDNNANDKDVILRSDNGSGGLAAYITLDGSAGDIKFSKNVDASSQNIVAYYLEGTYKSFLIDHPTQEGKKLRHGCLEGPEHGVYFRGKSSDSIIECPEYWMGLVEEDSVTVQLTAIGPNQNIYVDHIDEDGNIHVGSNTDEPLNYYYTVNGERKGDKVVVVEDA